MKKKDLSDLGFLVYSTNPDLNPGSFTPPPSQQQLIVYTDKKNRSGKTVTIIDGFEGKTEDLEALAKRLKTRCGTGGTVKENIIMIQGDFRNKIIDFLKNEGYKVK